MCCEAAPHACSAYGGLLLQMSHVALSVYLCVGLLGTRGGPAKTAEPIEMQFGGLSHVGPRNH